MIAVRKAARRGQTRFDWLDSRHSFSFGHYFDPENVQFGALRVINDDWISGGGGFPPHSHRDMEIVTYMVTGTLAHEDSTGGRETIGPGEVQRMTAGTGITHSEFNASDTEPVRLLQIWLLPAEKGLKPGYEQTRFSPADKAGKLLAIASGRGKKGALRIHQDADIYASVLAAGDRLSHALAPGRQAWVQVVTGGLALNGLDLAEGDGAAITNETALDFAAAEGAEFLLFELA